MKKHCLVTVLALLTIAVGVSFGREQYASECNLKTLGNDFENYGVTYQYSVLKNGGIGTGTVRDWTVFDIDKSLIVDSLEQGNYTFNIRSLSPSGAVMYQGSETCFMVGGAQKSIPVTLYPQIDENNKETFLEINLLNSASGDFTASVVYKSCSTGDVVSHALSKCSTGFSSRIKLAPGYYEMSVYVFSNEVLVGGLFDIVFVPTGYVKVSDYEIYPRQISNVVDIATTENLTLTPGGTATVAWKGSTNGNKGQWILNGQVVEKSANYYQLSTLGPGSNTIEYHIGDSVFKCNITVGGGTKVNILNFRSATPTLACIGYKDKATGKSLGLGEVEVSGSSDDLTDWQALNLEPIYGVLDGAEFGEITELGNLSSDQFGKDLTKPNTSLKVLIVHGDILENVIGNKLGAIETMIFDGPTTIDRGAVKDLTTLKNVVIIPPTGVKTTISREAFYGCNALEHVYVIGDSTKVEPDRRWSNNSSASDIEYVTELPL